MIDRRMIEQEGRRHSRPTVERQPPKTSTPTTANMNAESRQDQEEGGELDSHEEASPEEIESREVELGYREREREMDFFCVSCFPTAQLRTLPL